jgi:hypothetical protein
MSSMMYPTGFPSTATRPGHVRLVGFASVDRLLKTAARWERPAWIVATVASSVWALYGLAPHLWQ